MSIFPVDYDTLDSKFKESAWGGKRSPYVFSYGQRDERAGFKDTSWVSNLKSFVAMVANTADGYRFDVVSCGLVARLGTTASELSGRLVANALHGAFAPLHGALAQTLRGGPPLSVDLIEGSKGFPLRAEVRSTGLHGLAIVEFVALEQKIVDREEGVFENLNRIGGGSSYVYDRKPWLGMNLSVLLGAADNGVFRVRPEIVRRKVHPDDLALLKAHRRALYEKPSGTVQTTIVRVKAGDGEWRWIQAREQVLTRDARGRVLKIRGFATDITEHRQLAHAVQKAASEVLEAQQDERRRIAREIHDALAQHLVLIDLTMSRLEREAPQMPTGTVDDIRKAVRAAHAEVRAFSYLLHPPELSQLGLSGAVAALGRGFGIRTGLAIKVDIGALPDLPPIAQLTLFRIAQEALMNVHRHAQADAVDLSLKVFEGGVLLEVTDDGMGVRPSELKGPPTGVGLAGIRARLVEIGGALQLSAPERGLRLRAWLPLEDRSGSEQRLPRCLSDEGACFRRM